MEIHCGCRCSPACFEAAMAVDATDALKGLLDVAKVALGAGAEVSPLEAGELLHRLLAIVDQTMPIDLQEQDVRVMRARSALKAMRQ